MQVQGTIHAIREDPTYSVTAVFSVVNAARNPDKILQARKFAFQGTITPSQTSLLKEHRVLIPLIC